MKRQTKGADVEQTNQDTYICSDVQGSLGERGMGFNWIHSDSGSTNDSLDCNLEPILKVPGGMQLKSHFSPPWQVWQMEMQCLENPIEFLPLLLQIPQYRRLKKCSMLNGFLFWSLLTCLFSLLGRAVGSFIFHFVANFLTFYTFPRKLG